MLKAQYEVRRERERRGQEGGGGGGGGRQQHDFLNVKSKHKIFTCK